jgi:hypothetical protein
MNKISAAVVVTLCSCAVVAAPRLVFAFTVASLDSGSSASEINRAPGEYDFYDNDSDASDPTSNQHGSTSSRLINLGAPGVPILPLKITGSFEGNSTPAATSAAIAAAAANPNVRIIAISAGSPDPSSAVATASAAGKLITIRAGNDGASSPIGLAAAAAGLPGVMIVGATDYFGVPLEFSNKAGSTANRYVMTTGYAGSYSNLVGTSYASARMAGIAAAVLQATPNLSAEDLAQVIFAAATPVSGDYGHGFVADSSQVINNPAGPVSVASDSGGSGGGAAVAALALGAAAGAAIWYRSRKDLESTLVFDPYGRPFIMDLSDSVSIARTGPNISRFTELMDEVQNAERFSLSDRLQATLSYSTYDRAPFETERHFALSDDPAFNYRDLSWAFSLNGKLPGGLDFQINKNTDPGDSLGAISAIPYSQDFGHARFLSGQTFSTPYLGFADAADSVLLKFNPSGDWETKFAVVNADEGEGYARTESVAAFFEGAYNFRDRGRVGMQIGQLQEAGSLFGGSSGGALSVDSNSSYALNFSGSARVTDSLSLVGNYGLGVSDTQAASGSLLKDFSAIRSNWFGVGIVGNGLLNAKDQMGFAVSQPLRVSDGEATLSVPYGLDSAGTISRKTNRISLAPEGRETALEAYYARSLDRNSSIGVFLLSRFEPDHDAAAGNELTAFTSYRLRF